MERTRGCLIALGIAFGVLIIAVAVAVGLGWYLLSRPIPLEQEMTAVTISQDASTHFQQKLESLDKQIRAAQKSGAEQTIRLEITPEEANSWAKEQIDRAISEGKIGLPSEVNDLQMNFSPSPHGALLKGTATGKFLGFNMPFGVTAEFKAADGQLWYEIMEIYMGNIPGFIKERAASAIEASLPEGRAGRLNSSALPVRYLDSIDFQRVLAENGNLVAEGLVKKEGV